VIRFTSRFTNVIGCIDIQSIISRLRSVRSNTSVENRPTGVNSIAVAF
jgi:hypothetical protein